MPRRKSWHWVWLALILLAVAAQLWLEERQPGERRSPSTGSAQRQTTKDFETLRNVHLEPDRNNDGDSFKIRHGGEVTEFRLHFVDAPEKRLHQFNGERLRDQGAYFGGLDLQATLALGIKAKQRVETLLTTRPFHLQTRWRPVFDSGRFFAFVFFDDDGDELSETLVREGLARIHTEGADLPDGRRRRDFERHLKNLEAQAKVNGQGGWAR